jgi:cysteine synthase
VAGIGTGGTLMGTGLRLRALNAGIQIAAVLQAAGLVVTDHRRDPSGHKQTLLVFQPYHFTS